VEEKLELIEILKEGVRRFSFSIDSALEAMIGVELSRENANLFASSTTFNDLSFYTHFHGAIQGIFLINISKESLALLSRKAIIAVEDVSEILREAINIGSAETIPYLESYFNQLTYTPVIYVNGEIHFPDMKSEDSFLRISQNCQVQCSLFLDLAEVKIGTELDKIKQSLSESEKRSKTDSLTNLYNRSFFDREFFSLFDIEKTKLNNGLIEGASLIWIDVDNFKSFNDSYGHEVGDRALSTIGKAIISSVRDKDYAFRYGGDEFVVLLSGANRVHALIVAERIQKKLENSPLECMKKCGEIDRIVITLSIGIAELNTNDIPATLLKRADSLLYKAKENGRSCAVVE
jgi:diguanylate cyclase (GGDEF)-like protein